MSFAFANRGLYFELFSRSKEKELSEKGAGPHAAHGPLQATTFSPC